MEIRFPQVLSGKYLTLNHVIHQFQYRYTRKLRDARQPALRKVLNCDIAASLSMILCVSKIISSNHRKGTKSGN